MTKNIIAYYRVSTKKQGESGLGLEGQKFSVQEFAKREQSMILSSYVEVETGKKSDRLEILKAISHARRSKATLVVAKLDRLARNVAFLSALMESGVDFVACDNPHANRLTIHILAAVAEDEAIRISERTKAALKAYKARGGVLGAHRSDCKKLSADARAKGRESAKITIKKLRDDAYFDLKNFIRELYAEKKSLREVRDALNALGHTTRQAKSWNHVQVRRVLNY